MMHDREKSDPAIVAECVAGPPRCPWSSAQRTDMLTWRVSISGLRLPRWHPPGHARP
jgi:hypothetical protein